MSSQQKDQIQTDSNALPLDDRQSDHSAKRCCTGLRLGIGIFAATVFAILGVGFVVGQNLLHRRSTGGESVSLSASQIVLPDSSNTANDGNGGQRKTDDQSDDRVNSTAEPAGHPIEPALDKARDGLRHSQESIIDYTATMIKRESDEKGNVSEQAMLLKVRNRKLDEDGKLVVPFAVYMKNITPDEGREVIWVEGANDGKLIAHFGGLLNLLRYPLDPEGPLAMQGQRYPIWDIGIEKLVTKLIERGELEKQHEQCDVQFITGAKIDDHPCTVIEIKHPEKNPAYNFYLARVFMDDERNIPLRYVAYDWPKDGSDELPINEEFVYQNVKLNVGLTDKDFDPDNEEYNYP